MISIARCLLVRILHYDAGTGLFHWRVRPCQRMRAGDLAGSSNTHGYIQIYIKHRLYLAHRLAWLYCYGYLPDVQVDHYDGDHANNRLSNLRLCLGSTGVGSILNQQNRKGPQANNTTGWLGVDYRPSFGVNCYRARMQINGESVVIGRYPTAQQAGEAYIEAKRKLHPFNTL